MEIIKCECNRLIMVLSREDMEKYNIGTENIIENVRTMLYESDLSRDFSSSRRLLVKIFESKEGGCELFITRSADTMISPDIPIYRKPEYIYRFGSISPLLLACRAIASSGFSGYGGVYYDNEKKHYYLIIDREFENICEFGAERCRRSSLMYIEEHCSRLCSCTVDLLSSLA